MVCTYKTLANYVTLDDIKALIKPSYLAFMEQFVPLDNLVYTSFDGDYMHYVCHMQEYVMAKGLTPINPEAALGYYVSTMSHAGNKVPVMMDCIRTELLCDHMWIFNPHSGHVSEGVLAELMIWNSEKNKNVSVIDFFPENISHIDTAGNFNVRNLSTSDIDAFISTRSDTERAEINSKLLAPYKKQELQNAYIIVNFKNCKHLDWARSFCYQNHLSPVCAQTLLPYHLYSKPEYGNEKYLSARLNLLSRADNILLFLNTRRIKEEISKLDEFSLCEMYYVLQYKKDVNVEIVGWDDACVPKYSGNGTWALTTAEASEV